MKKLYWIFSLLIIFSSCGYFEDDKSDFIEAYKKILIIRETMQADSLKKKADKEVQKIYEEYDYTEESFKEEFFEIANENTREFYNLLDSIRNSVRAELESLETKEKQQKKKSKEE